MPQDNNNNVSKGIRVANTVAGLPYTIARGVNDAIQEVNRRLVRRRVRNAPTAATLSLVTGPYLSPIISGLALDVLTVSSIMHRGKKTTPATNTLRKTTVSTPKQGNSNSGVNTIDGGLLPEVVVIGKRPKKEGSLSGINLGRTGGASRNRRTGSPRRNRLGQINIGGGYQEKAYTPETGLNPEIVERVAAQPPQGMAISFPEQITNPTFTAPETIEVPQVSTPGTFTRRDVRNMLRAKGINPYYEIGGLQRRALRRYLNGEPVAGEYQDFINKIMQQ